VTSRGWLFLLPGVAVMGAFFFLPFALVAWTSVSDPTPGLENYREIATSPLYVTVLRNTIRSALWTTLGCVLVGYPVAYAIHRARGRWRQVMLGLVLFTYAVGTLPRALAWVIVLGDRGLVNQTLAAVGLTRAGDPVHFLYNQAGVLIGMIHAMLPFFTLILLGAMARVSRNLVPAARTLGASPVRAFFLIFVPLTRPGLVAGALLIFIYSLGFYVIPAALGGLTQTTVVMLIQSLVLTNALWGLGAALSALLVVVAVGGAAVYVRLTGLTHVGGHE
jgi:putative spermidine/putrescine transport system permease protein